MARRAGLAALLLGGVALGAHFARAPGHTAETVSDPEPARAARIVSLSPGIAETLVALDRADRLVGQSDYGPLPETVPRVGSALTPELEAIARLEPDLIIGAEVRGDGRERLARIARTEYLPWLTVEDMASGVERLGQWVDAVASAQKLAMRLRDELTPRPRPDSPRLLWVIDLGEAQSAVTWFIRPDSLHGQLLVSLGYRNAIEDPVPVPPRLTPEQLLELAPDGFIAVTTSAKKPRLEESLRAHLERFAPLAARPLWVVAHEPTMTLGPHIVDLRKKLQAALPRPDAESPD